MRKTALFLTLILTGHTMTGCASPQPAAPGVEREAKLNRADKAALKTARESGALVIVDKSDRRLTLYQSGRPVMAVEDIRFGNAPIGHKQVEGDERTPEGLYTIDARNPGSAYHLSLRINYPNPRDTARATQSGVSPGGNIFIHGQPNGYDGAPIPTDWTDGCIALSNAEIEKLWAMVPDGTPIYIRR